MRDMLSIKSLMKWSFKDMQNLHNSPIGKPLYGVRLLGGRALVNPLYLMIAPTLRCNMKCSYCQERIDLRNKYPDLTLDMVVKLERNIRSSYLITRPRIHLIGGEPTVNEDFLDILRYFDERDYKLSFTTNGLLLDRMAGELRKISGLVVINISLNHMNYDKPEEIRNVVSKIKQGLDCEIVVNVPMDLVDQMDIQMDQLAREFEGSDVDSLCVLHSTTVFMDCTCCTGDEMLQKIDDLREYALRIEYNPKIKKKDIKRYYEDKEFPSAEKGCLFPWFVMKILPNGDVIPCPIMYNEVKVMGNVLETKISKIWNGATFRNYRNDIRNKSKCAANPFCSRCPFRQYY